MTFAWKQLVLNGRTFGAVRKPLTSVTSDCGDRFAHAQQIPHEFLNWESSVVAHLALVVPVVISFRRRALKVLSEYTAIIVTISFVRERDHWKVEIQDLLSSYRVCACFC